MPAPIYAYQSDELGQSATVTLTTGTADANYPVTNVQTFDPSDIFLSTSTAGIDIVWDHGSAVDVKVFSLHHFNIPAALAGVKVQRNAANSWGAPTIDYTLVIPARPNDNLPLPLAVDLTGVTGYNGATGFRYSRLHIPNPSQLIGLGSVLWWGAKRQDLHTPQYPVRKPEQQPTRLLKTAHGVRLVYSLGVRLRFFDSTIRTTNADTETWIAWFRAARGNYKAFLFWLDPTVSTDGWLSVFDGDTAQMEYAAWNYTPVQLSIAELACGLAIPTA